MRALSALALGSLAVGALLRAQDATPRVRIGSVTFDDAAVAEILALSPLPEPPDDPTNRVSGSERAARLGRALFFDRRLSASGEVSCATCHEPAKGWSDGRPQARGEGAVERHSMSLWNVAYNRWFFWDGRADSLWSQALFPLEEPREQGTTRTTIAKLVGADPDLTRAYEELFGPLPDLSDDARFPPRARPPVPRVLHDVPIGAEVQPPEPEVLAWEAMSEADRALVNEVFVNVGKSIAAFERRIVSRRAPFDVFVEGIREDDPVKQRALSESGKRGLALFLGKARCHICHTGPNFTDKEFHNNRIPPQEGRASMDPGRFLGVELVQASPWNGVGAFSDDPVGDARTKVAYLVRNGHNWAEFKTPSLRNVAVTAPYMHEGQFATLEEVLRYYSTLDGAMPLQHGGESILQALHLDDGEIADLVAFLEALTDIDLPIELQSAPSVAWLPEDTASR